MKYIITKEHLKNIKENFPDLDYETPENIINDIVSYVDYFDLANFISKIEKNPYWRNDDNIVSNGEITWAIFSYLTDREIFLIEDIYHKKAAKNSNRSYYIRKESFHNGFMDLYYAVLKKLVEYKYFDEVSKDYYTISKSKIRNEKINNLI